MRTKGMPGRLHRPTKTEGPKGKKDPLTPRITGPAASGNLGLPRANWWVARLFSRVLRRPRPAAPSRRFRAPELFFPAPGPTLCCGYKKRRSEKTKTSGEFRAPRGWAAGLRKGPASPRAEKPLSKPCRAANRAAKLCKSALNTLCRNLRSRERTVDRPAVRKEKSKRKRAPLKPEGG